MQYAKAIVGVIGAAITAALGLVPSDSKLFMVLTIAAAAVTAAGVYLVPNVDKGNVAGGDAAEAVEVDEPAVNDVEVDDDDMADPEDLVADEEPSTNKHVAA